MPDQSPVHYVFPHLPGAVARLEAGCREGDFREVFRLALSHAGNEADAAHAFLERRGLGVINIPGGRRALVLLEEGLMTFGRTNEGEQCDESDLHC